MWRLSSSGVSRRAFSRASAPSAGVLAAQQRIVRQQNRAGTALCGETCSAIAQPPRSVATHAVAPATDTEQWWSTNLEHWTEVSSEEEFMEAIQDDSYSLVLVDWYATWCKGCKRAYSELSKMAASERYRGKVKFVKACVEKVKSLSKREGIKVLPQCTVYRPEHGRLLSFQAVPSKLKILNSNLGTMLDNPDKFFKLDPNGFAVPTDTDPNPELRAKKKDAEALASSSSGLFDRLMASASGSSGNGKSSNGSAKSSSSSNSSSSTGQAAAAARAVSSTSSSAPAGAGANGSAACGDKMAQAKQGFLARWSGEYGYGGKIDDLYKSEIGCRMGPKEHYLDYTGSALYCNTPLRESFTDLQTNVYGNPHSANPSSSLSSERIEDVRDMILKFFNADPAEYQVVFTNSATGALKTIGETFPWQQGAVFRYTRENHNSVLGIREYALQHDARFQAVEVDWVEEWISGKMEDAHFVHPAEGSEEEPVTSLFAFPAEENFSGVKYPLRWIREIQSMSTPRHKWKVLLDAAAFVPTQPLDLTQSPADFVSISFYKMFGYPTGLGAMLIRTEDVDMMKKVFWGGGAVAIATATDDFHVLKCRPSEKFEDGTVNFLDIMNLRHMFGFVDQLGGIEAIHSHVHALTRHLYERLAAMRHANGSPLVEIFGQHAHPSPERVQGGIVNFEVLSPSGEILSYRDIELAAADAGFHIRTGVHCNPGAAYRDIGVTEAEVESLLGVKEGCGDEVDFIEVQRPEGAVAGMVSDAEILPALAGTNVPLGHPGEVAMKWIKKPLGSVRASLGYMSTFEDVEAFCQFMEHTYLDKESIA